MYILLEATENFIIAAMLLSFIKRNIGCISFKDLLQFNIYEQLLRITLISQVHTFRTLLLTLETQKHIIGAASNGIISIPSFIKISEMFQKS
jgi:hypothetical protein